MENFLTYINKWFYDRSFYLNSLYYYQIHITKRCQNKCKHCYYKEIGAEKTDIDIKVLTQMIEQIAKTAQSLSLNARIDFTGGDPFLYPELSMAIQSCRQYGVKYGFKCNPDFFIHSTRKDIVSLIYDCSEISLSIDGIRQSHDSWRGSGNFNKTIAAASIIKELNFCLRLNSTLSLDNLSNLIPLVEFLLRERIMVDDYTWARYWSRENREKIIPSSLLPRIFDEYSEYISQLFKNADFYYYNDKGQLVPRIFFGFKEHQWFPYFVSKGYIIDSVLNRVIQTRNCLNCTATKHIYIVDPDESIYRCRKIMDSSGYYLGQSEVINTFELEKSSQCTKCKYYNGCGGCAAMSLLFTDNYNSVEPGCTFFSTI